MKQITFVIDESIFRIFPNYRRAIVVATDINNMIDSPLLSESIDKLVKTVKSSITNDDIRIAAWHEAFATAGIKARDFRPSIDALVRRILNDKPIGSISPIVDIGTITSLSYVLPAGAHPLLPDTSLVTLRMASGRELDITQDGNSKLVPHEEIILVDTGQVATRRWVWRQTAVSRVELATMGFYLNIDALDHINDKTLQLAITSAQQLIKSVFSRSSQVLVLSANNPTQTIVI